MAKRLFAIFSLLSLLLFAGAMGVAIWFPYYSSYPIAATSRPTVSGYDETWVAWTNDEGTLALSVITITANVDTEEQVFRVRLSLVAIYSLILPAIWFVFWYVRSENELKRARGKNFGHGFAVIARPFEEAWGGRRSRSAKADLT